MMSRPFRAITFDFWRTLFDAQTNLHERRAARVRVIAEITGMPPERVTPAFTDVAREFLRIHIAEQRTPAAREAIPMLEERLEVVIDEERRETMVRKMADVFLAYPPAAWPLPSTTPPGTR